MDEQGNAATNQAANDKAVVEVSQPLTAQSSSAHSNGERENNRSRKCDWTSRPAKSRQLTNWLMVILTFLIAGLYAGLLWVGFRQTDLTTEANKQAADANKAAKEAF